MNPELEHQLADARAQLAERDRDLAAAQARIDELTSELDATNRGIIALHSELETARDAQARALAENEIAVERDRIAHDLHDLIIRRVFGASIALQGAIGLMRQPAAIARVRSVVLDLDATIRQLRAAIFELHEEPAKATTLSGQLIDLTTQAQEALGHSPTLDVGGGIDHLPAPIAEDLLVITRAALSDIARPGDATHVEVVVRVDDELSLRIDADGTGLRQTPLAGERDSQLRTRATAHGGGVRITDVSATTTRLAWHVPLARVDRHPSE